MGQVRLNDEKMMLMIGGLKMMSDGVKGQKDHDKSPISNALAASYEMMTDVDRGASEEEFVEQADTKISWRAPRITFNCIGTASVLGFMLLDQLNGSKNDPDVAKFLDACVELTVKLSQEDDEEITNDRVQGDILR